LMASRSNNGMFVASHAGTNGESHNHNDVGDFMVYANRYPVIIDVGSGTYTARTFSKDRYKLWFNTSTYHNLPTVNGIEQKEGIQFLATDVSFNKDKNHSQLRMNIKNAYPETAGIKSWIRVVKMDKNQGFISITDKYLMDKKPVNLTQTFMTVCETDISTPGKIIFSLPDQTNVYLDYDKIFWGVSKEKIDLKTPEDEGLKHSWEGKDIWRILLTSKSSDVKKSIIYNIHK